MMARSGDFHIESEKENHIIHDDYNFDGKEDFSVWHMDEGMGVYKIYRVFIYSISTDSFNEIKPSCGDEFINIIINKADKNITSTYFDENLPKKCITNTYVSIY